MDKATSVSETSKTTVLCNSSLTFSHAIRWITDVATAGRGDSVVEPIAGKDGSGLGRRREERDAEPEEIKVPPVGQDCNHYLTHTSMLLALCVQFSIDHKCDYVSALRLGVIPNGKFTGTNIQFT